MGLDGDSALNEGIRLLQANDLQAALAQLQQAVQQNPQNGQAYGYLGIAQVRLGDTAAGITSLQNAARLQPTDSTAQYNLAVALIQAQRQPEARAALEQSLALDPNNQRARTALAGLPPAPTVSMPVTAPPAPAAAPTAPPLYAPANAPIDLSTGAPIGAPQQPAAPYMPPTPTGAGGYTPPPVGGTPLNAGDYSAPLPAQAPPAGLAGYNSYPAAAPAPQPGQANSYQAPPLYGAPAPGPSAMPGPAPLPGAPPPGGMYYTPQARPQAIPPSTGTRILRGIGWGALYGQWWTVWTVFSMLIWGAFSSHPGSNFVAALIVFIYAVVAAFIASIAGLIIGAIDAPPATGAVIGIIAGMVMLGLEFLSNGSPTMLINIIFYFFTGRFIGANVAIRARRPIQQ